MVKLLTAIGYRKSKLPERAGRKTAGPEDRSEDRGDSRVTEVAYSTYKGSYYTAYEFFCI
jgi:hypothetical protein